MSIQAIKGVEVGDGFLTTTRPGPRRTTSSCSTTA
jgi:chorismate synthase